MKVTIIATVLNEEKTLGVFLESLSRQSKKPDEIIIVDGGSSDKTVQMLKKYDKKIKVLRKMGNRSTGRNKAIMEAKYSVIAISDSGCILDHNWLKYVCEPLKNKSVEVVAGYYKSKSSGVFQKSLTPYVLVMPERVDPKVFLPASRSMAIRKKIWKKVNGFPENYSHNEDFAFAQQLKKNNIRIQFQKKAIAYWIPRNTIIESFIMFFRFAYGDAESGIYRPKVALIFLRYLIGVLLFLGGILVSKVFLEILIASFLLYVMWAIIKNYRYVNHLLALWYLPNIQLLSDLAVITGTAVGTYKHLRLKNFIKSLYCT